MGAVMHTAHVLDIMESLIRTAAHPDATAVSRYGRDSQPGGQSPAGVKVTHHNGSASMLWAAVQPRDATPVPVPVQMPCPGQRYPWMLMFAHRLLDAAQPGDFQSWELCAASGVGWPESGRSPSALRITGRDGSVAYLRATASSGPGGGAAEPDIDPYPDYQFPEGVSSWRHSRSAARAEPASV